MASLTMKYQLTIFVERNISVAARVVVENNKDVTPRLLENRGLLCYTDAEIGIGKKCVVVSCLGIGYCLYIGK